MRFTVLGPVTVEVGGEPMPVRRAQTRGVLAYLLLNAGRAVSQESIVEAVWGGSAPLTARSQIQASVYTIRRALTADAVAGKAALESGSFGYRLTAPADDVDLSRFETLVRHGRDAVDPAEAARLLRAGLAQWQGEALADAAGAFVGSERARLTDWRLSALADLADVELRLGRHAAVAEELVSIVDTYPMHEALRARFMIALYRAGRPVEALETFRRYRLLLADEQGLDPGDELRELEGAILRRDPVLAGPVPVGDSVRLSPSGRVVPAQLPVAAPHFVGRTEVLARLDELLDRERTTVLVATLLGTAGIGKSATAVNWAHRVAERFPDGQLYVNLRGFDPTGPAMAPTEALVRFLEALGVSPPRIPAQVDAQIDLYRRLVNGRRILVVLDNAFDAEQVRPLLPGTPTAMVVVTSRNRLTGLVAVDGAYPLSLGLLTEDEARELLARRLGGDRVAAESRVVDEIIVRCARLPLALAIAAARAAIRSDRPLGLVAAGLREAPMDAFRDGDIAIDVRTVFSWSYRALAPETARLFRLLGLHPGPDVAAAAAARLAGRPADRTRALLAELTDAHLVIEDPAGRFSFHDLLRAYAAELARAEEPEASRRAAVQRLLDHYVHTAHRAALLIRPHRDPDEPPPPAAVEVTPLADRRAALDWLEAERRALLAAVQHAADEREAAGLAGHAWRLTSGLATFLELRGHWHDWVVVLSAALAAAERLGDRRGEAETHRRLTIAYERLGRRGETDVHLSRALDIFGEIGDLAGQGDTHGTMARIVWSRGQVEDAVDHAERAVTLFLRVGDLSGLATALNTLSGCLVDLGQHALALRCARHACWLFRRLSDERSEADAWDSIGYVHSGRGHHERAIACYQRSYDMWRDSQDRYGESVALARLGDAYHALGDVGRAGVYWRKALRIPIELDHPHARRVRAKLARAGLSA